MGIFSKKDDKKSEKNKENTPSQESIINYNEGVKAFDSEKYQEAVEFFNKSVQLDPKVIFQIFFINI
jgi:hypothetical protein